MEELAWIRAHALMVSLHSDICMPYLKEYGTPEQMERFLRPSISGDCILAVGMTEPGTGSDLANVQTRAIRDGDEYVLNGAKTFISNGQISDLVIVVAKTDPQADPPHDGISLILVEGDRPGFRRGRNLEKLGLKGQDTSELFFEDCRVPVENLLGQEGRGFKMLMNMLQQERLSIAVSSMASCRRALHDTIDYVRERRRLRQAHRRLPEHPVQACGARHRGGGGPGLRGQAAGLPRARRRGHPGGEHGQVVGHGPAEAAHG